MITQYNYTQAAFDYALFALAKLVEREGEFGSQKQILSDMAERLPDEYRIQRDAIQGCIQHVTHGQFHDQPDSVKRGICNVYLTKLCGSRSDADTEQRSE